MKKWLLILILFQSLHMWSQNEGDIHRREGNLEEAIKAYRKEFRLNPSKFNNTYNLACAYALLHQKDSAFSYLEKALENDKSLWVLADSDLFSLHTDQRWLRLENKQLAKFQEDKGQLNKPTYAKELLRLIVKDQMFDFHMDMAKRFFAKNGKAPHWYYPIAYTKKEVTKENFLELERLLKIYGWPTYNDVGKLAADGPLLIINHHEKEEIRLKYLPQIKQACLAKQGSCVEYAKIKDRALVNTDKLQLYGMQFEYNVNNQLVPLPIFEPEYVDERRKEIGLPPLKQYLKRKINYDFNVKQKKK